MKNTYKMIFPNFYSQVCFLPFNIESMESGQKAFSGGGIEKRLMPTNLMEDNVATWQIGDLQYWPENKEEASCFKSLTS